MLFGHLAIIVRRDTTVMQATAGKQTYYNFPTLSAARISTPTISWYGKETSTISSDLIDSPAN